MSGTKTLAVVFAVAAIAACHHEKKQTTPLAHTPPPAEDAPKQTASQNVPVSSNLSANDDLVKQCQLRFDNQEQAPKFDFDQSSLTSLDRDVLQQIATCLTKGPLKGRAIHLVGRADPRGTDEYNLALGDRRAKSVAEYLTRLGMTTNKIEETTRGAIDASGHDEDTWRIDRRVDLELN